MKAYLIESKRFPIQIIYDGGNEEHLISFDSAVRLRNSLNTALEAAVKSGHLQQDDTPDANRLYICKKCMKPCILQVDGIKPTHCPISDSNLPYAEWELYDSQQKETECVWCGGSMLYKPFCKRCGF